MTEINRKTRSYEKYGTTTNPKCTCGKDHSNCICGKGQYSVTTTVTKRSDNVKGQIDLTPKLKINLTPDKIRKAVEEQRRIAEEDKKRRANRTININTEENSRRYVKEERKKKIDTFEFQNKIKVYIPDKSKIKIKAQEFYDTNINQNKDSLHDSFRRSFSNSSKKEKKENLTQIEK